MGLALVLLVPLLHRGFLDPVEAPSAALEGKASLQPARSPWPLRQCQEDPAGCVCDQKYQVCQPLQLSARVNESITLPCSFAHRWELPRPARPPQVHWRLGSFHSQRYLFNCCQSPGHTDRGFQGRVSLAGGGQLATASIRITALQESDSQLYFCRVSVKTKNSGEQAWQTVHGTNLTVTAPPPEGRAPAILLPQGLLAGVSVGAVLLAAALLLGLGKLLWKGHCRKRTHTRRGQGEEEAEAHEEVHGTGAGAPPWEQRLAPPPSAQASGEAGLTYATLELLQAPARPPRGASRGEEEETPYAALRH